MRVYRMVQVEVRPDPEILAEKLPTLVSRSAGTVKPERVRQPRAHPADYFARPGCVREM
jgi:hypothetical protein